MIYYGDEIGLKYQRGLHKDGGSKRTGARTPMQWDNSKNKGFSVSDEIYLPVSDDEVSVKTKDGTDGLLDTVRKLSELRSSIPINADIRVLNVGYPFVYTRAVGNTEYIVFLQPAKKGISYKIKYGEVLLSNNCSFLQGEIKTNGVGFAILKRQVK